MSWTEIMENDIQHLLCRQCPWTKGQATFEEHQEHRMRLHVMCEGHDDEIVRQRDAAYIEGKQNGFREGSRHQASYAANEIRAAMETES